MRNVQILIKRVREGFEDFPLPQKATVGAAGFDIYAAIDNEITIHPFERVLIPTSFSVAIPEGYEIQVRPRSGLAIKYGLTLLNTPGTIDSDYRGEINLILIHLGKEPYTIRRGDRIAQLVVSSVIQASFEEVQELPDTSRGTGGFGHTGR
ncbi:MAG: dUTP diphosphatase [bacterium]|nr:dUTP diphosphatase [bacterium]